MRGGRTSHGALVDVATLAVDVAAGAAGAVVDVEVGAVEGVAVAADVALSVVASVGVAVGATGVRVLVFVARMVGLGVRKSYESVPTRCGSFVPVVNVGCAVCISGACGFTGNTNAASTPKTT